MHARELAELAGMLAGHAELLVEHDRPLVFHGAQQYWSACKCRLDRWGWSIKMHASRLSALPALEQRGMWRLILPVLEEILTSEILTRVWMAVCVSVREHSPRDEVAPLARNVLAGHLEARHRVLHLLFEGSGLPIEDAVLLNRLRRRNERWTDLLLSRFPQADRVQPFAFCHHRLRQWKPEGIEDRATRRSLLEAGLRASYQRGFSLHVPNGDLNRQVASGILAALPTELFDSTGLLRSLWLERLYHTTADAAGMIESLLSRDDSRFRI